MIGWTTPWLRRRTEPDPPPDVWTLYIADGNRVHTQTVPHTNGTIDFDIPPGTSSFAMAAIYPGEIPAPTHRWMRTELLGYYVDPALSWEARRNPNPMPRFNWRTP